MRVHITDLTSSQSTSFQLTRMAEKWPRSPWLRPIRTGILVGNLSSRRHKGLLRHLCWLRDLLCSDWWFGSLHSVGTSLLWLQTISAHTV